MKLAIAAQAACPDTDADADGKVTELVMQIDSMRVHRFQLKHECYRKQAGQPHQASARVRECASARVRECARALMRAVCTFVAADSVFLAAATPLTLPALLTMASAAALSANVVSSCVGLLGSVGFVLSPCVVGLYFLSNLFRVSCFSLSSRYV